MRPGPYEQVPLTDDERNWLRDLYHTRRRIVWTSAATLMVLAFIIAQRNPDTVSRKTGRVIMKWEETEDGKLISRKLIKLLQLGFLEIPLASCFLFIWYKKVDPISRDLKGGVKDKIPYEIVRKEYFPLTNQFYVALDDPNYLHHEIDEATYYNCSEGGLIYVFRAPLSKFVFEESGRFVLL